MEKQHAWMDIFDGTMSVLLKLDSAFLTEVREQFRLPVDTSDVWTLFACRTGGVDFDLEGGPGTSDGDLATARGGRNGGAAFGDVVLCPPGVRFRRRMNQPTSFLWARFESTATLPVGRTPVTDLPRLAGTFDRLSMQFDAAASTQVSFPTAVTAAHYVSDIVLLCVESHVSVAGLEDQVVEAAVRALVTGFTDPDLRLGGIAARLNIAPAVLTRRFRAAHGRTPAAFLRDLRLQRARVLLLETTDTLSVVSRACGYADPFYFTRVCTREWGMSPTQFRRRYRF